MKTFNMQYLIILLAACVLVGCGRNGSKAKLDMKPLETGFASANPSIKSVVEKSVVDAKAANYRGALYDLATLLKNPNVTSEQLQLLQDTMHQLSFLLPLPQPSMQVGLPK